LREWSTRHERLKLLRDILETAYRDRERCEVVSLRDSNELQIAHGEVLRTPRYMRIIRL
jgi:hypothetical protein